MTRWCLPFVLLGAVLLLQACRKDPGMEQPTDAPFGPTPLTLSVPSWAVDTGHALNLPYDNPLTVEGVALGRRLFYEKALSNDFSMSCATCHRQENAFSDPRRVSIGTDGSEGRRQGMAIINAAWDHFFFWDARALSLELQAFGPVRNPIEMGNSWHVVVQRLQQHPEYPELFRRAFGTSSIDSLHVAYALAQFERTLISLSSRFDRFHYDGDITAMTPQEVRGMDLFFGDAHCDNCHMLPLFQDHGVRNIGLPPGPDQGLAEVSGITAHRGRFKTTTLRNIAVTAPYMHDGRFATLEEVVDFYADDVVLTTPNLDEHMFPWVNDEIHLNAQDRADLVAFMRTLTDEAFLSDPRFSDPH